LSPDPWTHVCTCRAFYPPSSTGADGVDATPALHDTASSRYDPRDTDATPTTARDPTRSTRHHAHARARSRRRGGRARDRRRARDPIPPTDAWIGGARERVESARVFCMRANPRASGVCGDRARADRRIDRRMMRCDLSNVGFFLDGLEGILLYGARGVCVNSVVCVRRARGRASRRRTAGD
jgi:hypothetical protein